MPPFFTSFGFFLATSARRSFNSSRLVNARVTLLSNKPLPGPPILPSLPNKARRIPPTFFLAAGFLASFLDFSDASSVVYFLPFQVKVFLPSPLLYLKASLNGTPPLLTPTLYFLGAFLFFSFGPASLSIISELGVSFPPDIKRPTVPAAPAPVPKRLRPDLTTASRCALVAMREPAPLPVCSRPKPLPRLRVDVSGIRLTSFLAPARVDTPRSNSFAAFAAR